MLKATGCHSDVLSGLRGSRIGPTTALLCLSVVTASNSSSWASGRSDIHTHVHAQKCIQQQHDFLDRPLLINCRDVRAVGLLLTSCMCVLLPANQVGFGLLCQLADASLRGGAEGDRWVLKQQLPLLLLRVLLHVPGWPSPLVTCAHGPPFTLTFLLLRRLPAIGSLRGGLWRSAHLLIGSSAAPPQRWGLRWLRGRSRFISSYQSGPAAPSRRRWHARVRQHRCFLCRRCPAFVSCGVVELLIGGGAPAVTALPHLLQLLLALPASLLARGAILRSRGARRRRDLWRTRRWVDSGLPPPLPHAEGHMTTVTIQVGCVLRWRADERAWGKDIQSQNKGISNRQVTLNITFLTLITKHHT